MGVRKVSGFTVVDNAGISGEVDVVQCLDCASLVINDWEGANWASHEQLHVRLERIERQLGYRV